MSVVDTAVRVEIAGESVELLVERAVYWPGQEALFIADVHLGKPAAFRASGIPLPMGTTESDLTRLSSVISRTGAQHLYVLGDLYHHESGRDSSTMDYVARWKEEHPKLEVHVIMGNHDRRTRIGTGEFGFRVYADPLRVGPFLLCHEPQIEDEAFVLCGHVHPSVILRDGRESLRLPCYWIGKRQAMLPAFGQFTGTGVITPAREDRVFVITEDEVVEAG